MSDDAALRAYLLKNPGGISSTSSARRPRSSPSAASIPIPPLDELLGSDDESDDLADLVSTPQGQPRPTRPVPLAPPPPPLAASSSTVEDLLESSTLSLIASTAFDLLTYALFVTGAYLACFVLSYALPYPFIALHFALRQLERLSHLLVWLGRWAAVAAAALLALGLAGLALAWVWFKWGEKAWDGRAPVARNVFLGLAAFGVVWRYAPWWGKWVVLVGLAGAGWRAIEPEFRVELSKMVLHPREFWGEVMAGYRAQVEILEREDREAAGVPEEPIEDADDADVDEGAVGGKKRRKGKTA